MASIPKRSAVERAARAMRASRIATSAACIRRAMLGASSGSQTQPFAREAGADEEEQRVARPAAQLRSGGASQCLALTWMKVLQIHPVIDDVELLPPDAEGALHLVAHHLRVADHGAQARMLEHLFFGAADVAVIRIQGNSNPLDRKSTRLNSSHSSS